MYKTLADAADKETKDEEKNFFFSFIEKFALLITEVSLFTQDL